MALQTKTFSLGSFDRYTGTSNGYILDLILTEESVDIQANTSQVSYKLQLRSGPSNRFDWELESALTLNGTQVASATDEGYLDYDSAWELLSGQVTVPHSADGKLDMAFSATVTPWNGGTQYTPPALTLTGTMMLTEIARASTIAASGAYIEETATIVVGRKAPGYTHSIGYRFGKLTGYLADATGTLTDTETQLDATAVLFPIPVDFYKQIPAAPSGVCTLTCTTYADGVQVGQPQTATFTVTADPARCAPTISATVSDINGTTLNLTGSAKTLVMGQSAAKYTVSVAPKNGASIRNVYLNGVTLAGATATLTNVAVASFTFRVEDSRGYWSEYTVPGLTIVDYVPISATASASRDDPTSGAATLTVTGKWFSGQFGSKANTLSCQYQVDGGAWAAATIRSDGENYTATAQLTGLDYRSAHQIQVQVSDKLQTLTKTATLSRGIPVFDWGENDFAFHVPVRFTATDGTVFTLDLSDGQLTAIVP